MKKTTLFIVMAALCPFLNAISQRDTANVSSTIINENGAPIANISIRIKGSNMITTTDNKGKFQLSDISAKSIFILSAVGYQTKELHLSEIQKNGKITLEPSDNQLAEVQINAGYYTVKEKESTGSISRVTAETIAKQPVNNLYAALISQMPGVQITQKTGVPGGGFDIVIRGRNSLRKTTTEDGNLPLYIIDGVPFIPATFGSSNANSSITQGGPNPLSTINPNDIESVEILKDGDATAIYGSRGANGVVLITTKKGKSNEAQIDLNFNQGIGQVPVKMNLLHTDQYLEMRKEAFKNDAQTPTTASAPDLLVWDQKKYTDWQDVLTGGTSKSSNLSGSFSGGSSGTHYFVSGNYYHEGTVYPGDFNYKKGATHFSLDHTSKNQKFKASLSSTYWLERSQLLSVDLMEVALRLAPNAPEGYDDQGKLNWTNFNDNPFSLLLKHYKRNANNLINSINISYEILSGLKLKSSLSYNKYSGEEILLSPLSSRNPASGSTSGSNNFVSNSSETFLAEPQIDFNKVYGRIAISALIGSTLQKNRRKGNAFAATGFSSDALLEDITSASSVTALQFTDVPYNYVAAYSRINLKLDEKYILNLTGRRDGSSRFAPESRFANFMALGGAWIFSKESIVVNKLPIISYGKLRASYGITGSDQIGDFKYLDLWRSSLSYDGKSGLVPAGLFNNQYGWEKNKKFELALDLGFINDRILLTGMFYSNTSSNQLVGYSLAPTTGFSSITSNFPATVKNTGIELELNTNNLQSNNFQWRTSFNLTIPKNELTAFPGIEQSSYANTFQIGKPLSIKNSLIFNGVDNQTGIYNFKDKDFYPGANQTYYGGLSNTLNYKRFNLSFNFQFVKQKGNSYLQPFYFAPGGMINQPVYALDRWQQPGDGAPVQRYTQNYSEEYTNLLQSDYSIIDASFIRLKNLSLSYILPENLIKKLHLQHLKFYLQGQNLLTITNYKGFDPETQNGSLPTLRVIAAGCQLTF